MGRGATTRGATFTTMPLLAEVVLPPAMPSALAHLKGGAFEPVDGVGSRSLGQQPKHDTVGAHRCGQMHCGGEGGGEGRERKTLWEPSAAARCIAGGRGEAEEDTVERPSEHDTVGALRSGQMHCRGEGGERKGEAGGNVGETILAMPRSPEHDAVKIASAAEKCAPLRVQRGGGEGCMPIPLINGVW